MNSGLGSRNIPLGGLLLAWISLLGVVPALITYGFARDMIDNTTQLQIEKIQTEIQEVDETINMENVTIGLIEKSPCPERKYYDEADNLIAQDTYISPEDPVQCQLAIRWYFKDGVIVAKDRIELGANESIEKYREYYDSNGVVFLKEAFIRGGHPLQKEYLIRKDYQYRLNSMESPLPPPTMLYFPPYRP